MAQITSGSLTIVDVTDGAPGLNNTTVFLYRRAVSAPDKPTGNLTYTFSTASITGALEGWVQSINELTGSNPIWMIAAVASSNGETDVIESSEWAGPIKMAQNGQDGLPGTPGTNGLNQATIFIYKRANSATAPSSTTYTFATGGFTVPSGWSKTIPTEPKGKPCWVTSAIAIGAEATAELNWVAPSVLVEDGSDGVSPTVTTTENGVKIVDADGNETFITNGADGTSYYTFVRYSKNANGSGYVTTPTSETIYIGVYTGTKSSPPAYNDSGWTWSKYVGVDGKPGTQGPTGPTGPQGVSVTATRELYYLKTNSTDPAQITNANQIYTTDDVNQWTSVVPTYIGSGKYYTCIETTLSNGKVVWSAPVQNKGLTDANVNAANAIEIARGVRQHFFWVATDKSANVPAGAYVAEQPEESFYSNPTKGNILTRSDGIWIRNGVDKLATLQGSGLTFLVPTGTYKGQKSVSLNGSGLTFYNIGSSNSAAATLASDGLHITNGSIVLGTTDGIAAGNVTLSNKNFTRSINNIEHKDLRFAIGSKFGVASDGTLYATGGVFNSYYTKDETDEAIDEVEIGGRNLCLASGKEVSKDLSTSGTVFIFDYLSEYGKNNLSIDTQITLSFEAKASIAGLKIGGRYIRNSSNEPVTTVPKNNSFDLTTNWVRYTATFAISAIGADRIGFYIGGNTATSGIVYTRNVKVEIGTKATDWTAAPEDLKIGGRNLLQHSASLDSNSNYGITITRIEGDLYRVYGTSTASDILYLGVYNMSPLLVSANGEFTLSIDREPVDGVGIYLNYRTGSSTDSIPGPWSGLGNNKVTFTGQEDRYFRYIGLAFRGGVTVDFTFHMKLEKGNKATDWTPAPEDVQAEIDAKKSVHTIQALNSSGSQYTLTYANILSYSTEGRTKLGCRVASIEGIKVGDTVRMGFAVSDMNNAIVYIVGTVTSTTVGSYPSLYWTSHGLDTTIIDGGNILTNSIGANQIQANSINTSKLAVGDWTNLVTANELYPDSLPSSSVSISNGYLVKTTATQQYILLTKINPRTPNNFKKGDELYVDFYAKAASATTGIFSIYAYDKSNTYIGYNSLLINDAEAINIPTTETHITGTISLTNSAWDNAAYYEIDLNNATSNKVQIYLRKVIVRKKSAGELIVDGSITADKIDTGAIVVSKLHSDTKEAVLNSNIKIGGRNLLTGTAKSQVLTTAANQNWFSPILHKLSTYADTAITDTSNTQISISFDYSITGVDTAFNMTASLRTDSSNGTYAAGFNVAEIPVGSSSGHAFGTRDITNPMRQHAPGAGVMISGSGNANANAKITISNVKLEFGNKATDWSPAPEDVDAAIADVKDTADKAAPKSSAVAKTQRIYYRSNSSTKPTAYPTTWVTEEGNKWNANATTASGWSRKVTPISNGTGSNVTKYLYLWTATQKQMVDGTTATLTAADIALDDSTTVIDGGKIITGSVTANQIAANTITSEKLSSNSITADKIRTGAVTACKIAIGDFNNYITANENDANTIVVNNLEIKDGWLYKNDAASNVWLSPVLNNWTSAGEKYRITGTIKAPQAGKAYFSIYGRDTSATSQAACSTSSITFGANIEVEVDTIITITDGVANQPKCNIGISFHIGETGYTYQVGYMKNLKCERMSGGELIVDGSISTRKLAVGDWTNLVTANEFYPSSIPYDTMTIDNGYIVKTSPTYRYILLTKASPNRTPNQFKTGDEFYVEFYAKAASATSAYFSMYCYNSSNTYVGGDSLKFSNGSYVVNLTTTEQKFTGTITLEHSGWNTAAYYEIDLDNYVDTKVQIYMRKIVVRKKSAGELIVDGSISAEKLKIGELSSGNTNYLAVIDNRKIVAAYDSNIKYGFNYDTGRYQLKTTSAVSANTQFSQIYNLNMPESYSVAMLQGKEACLAVDWVTVSDSNLKSDWSIFLNFYNSENTWLEGHSLNSTRLVKRFTVPSTATNTQVVIRMSQSKKAIAAGVSMTIGGLRLITGNVLQSWTLCPVDLYTDGDNVLTNSDNMNSSNYYVSNSSYGTAEWGVSLTPPGGKTVKGVRVKNTNTADAVGVAQTSANMRRPLGRGVYTISAWVLPSADGEVSLYPFQYTDNNIPYLGKTYKVRGGWWQRLSWAAVHDGRHSGATYHAGGYVYYKGTNNNDTCDICCIKLEAGSEASGWCPAESELASTATKYVTEIDKDGIRVHPESNQNDRITLTGSGMYIYKDNVQQAYFEGANIGLGRNDSNQMTLSSSGAHIYNVVDSTTGRKEVALFGSTARVGRTDAAAFYMMADKLQAYYMNGSTRTKYFEVSPNGISFGNKTQADILNDNVEVGGTNLLRNSKLRKSGTVNGITFAADSGGPEYIHISGTATANVDEYIADLQYLTAYTNMTVTISANYVFSGADSYFWASTSKNGAWYKDYKMITYYSASERRLTINLESGETLRYLRAHITNGTSVNGGYRFKIEVGNKQTQWSPCPDDVSDDIDASKAHFGICETAAATAAKTATISGFKLENGAEVGIRFNAGNTVETGITLNISSTGVRNINWNGSIAKSPVVSSYGILHLIYDGVSGAWRVTNGDASTVATKYVTDISGSGIYISPANQSPTSTATGNSVKIDGTGMVVYKGGTSVAEYGDSARIGKEASNHITIDATNGMQIFTGTESDSTNVAQFGSSIRIGAKNKARFLVNATSLQAYDSSNKKYFEITNTGMSGNLITAGKIQSKNGLIYFDLDNNDLVCSKLTSPSFTTTANRTILEVPTEYVSAGGAYHTYFKIYDSSQPDYGFTIRPYGSQGSGYQYTNVSSKGAIRMYGCTTATDTGGSSLILDASNNGNNHFAQMNVRQNAWVEVNYDNSDRTSFAIVAADMVYLRNAATVQGKFTATGTKSRLIKTDNYSDRLLYCYETPTPLFGDIGEAILDGDGYCYIDIDDIFSETIANQVEYQVFLQKEGQGDCWIEDKQQRYFIIKGTPKLKVAWELKAKQKDYEMIRLEQNENGLDEYENIEDINLSVDNYIIEQEELFYGNN